MVAEEIEKAVHRRAGEFESFGIRDVILPATRLSQATTAKLLADNPTLMRLRELEVLVAVGDAMGAAFKFQPPIRARHASAALRVSAFAHLLSSRKAAVPAMYRLVRLVHR